MALSALGYVLLASAAMAAAPPPADLIDHAALQQSVQKAQAGAYRQALARYASALREHPQAELAVAQCRFIEGFNEEDYGEWVESAPEDHEHCIEVLKQQWPDEPVARLYLYEQIWGDEAIEQGDALLQVSDGWPPPLRRKLLATVARHYDSGGQSARAEKLALQAAQMGDVDSVPLGVERLLSLGDQQGAAELLRRSPIAANRWRGDTRLRAAIELSDPQVARRELQRHLDGKLAIAPVIAARIHLNVGELDQAVAVLKDTEGSYEDLRQLRFDIALARDDVDGAVAEVLADDDQFAQEMQRFAVLAQHAPRSLWRGPMLWAALVLVAALVALALLPGVLLVPVHYRGLLRRLRGRPAAPLFASVGLRHAWIGTAVVLCVPFIVAFWLEPRSVAALLDADALPAARTTFRITLWGSLCTLLLLAPWIYRLGRDGWLGGVPLWRQGLWVVLAWLLLFVLGLITSRWHFTEVFDAPSLHPQFVDQMVNDGTRQFGMPMAFLLTAVLAPLGEEFAFRGLLLGGMSRHIGFAWANSLQALLFALAHDDWPSFPFYLGVGLMAGLLVKKTRGLGAAVALHAMNNGVAFFLLLR